MIDHGQATIIRKMKAREAPKLWISVQPAADNRDQVPKRHLKLSLKLRRHSTIRALIFSMLGFFTETIISIHFTQKKTIQISVVRIEHMELLD